MKRRILLLLQVVCHARLFAGLGAFAAVFLLPAPRSSRSASRSSRLVQRLADRSERNARSSSLGSSAVTPRQRGMTVVRPSSSIIIQRRPLLSSK
jgi:hypothetical protein